MKAICPKCEQKQNVKRVDTEEFTTVRGEKIRHKSSFYKCEACSAEFWNPSLPDPLVEAYQTYRAKHNFLGPDMIRDYRKNLGLSQKALASILGMSYPTLSRYENGSLQEETHNNLIRLSIENPGWVAERIEDLPEDLIPSKKRERVLSTLRNEERIRLKSLNLLEKHQAHSPSEFSGHVRFSPEKFKILILYFISKGINIKSVILKNLWFTDTIHYVNQGVSITGATYFRHHFGPIPDDNGSGLQWLIEDGHLEEFEEIFANGNVGYRYKALSNADLSIFNAEELETIEQVVKLYGRMTPRELSKLTHEQRPWRETLPQQKISFHLIEI